MDSVAGLIAQHGYPLLALIVFSEAIGAPVPAAIGLLVAGASSAHGPLNVGQVILVGVSAMVAGDLIMYTLGRLTGWWLLGMLCRLSVNPESCILRSADSFYKRGRSILLVCKFLPGLNTMATPLAGSMNMPLAQFLPLDLAGITLYIATYAMVGYLFSDFLGVIQNGYSTFGTVLGWLIALAVLMWIGVRINEWRKVRTGEPVTMISPSEIPENAAILDVRSHGYYDPKSQRIKGSTRFEPNAITCQIASVPADKEIILYCTCVKEATALCVARAMQSKGFKPKVLLGGLKAWQKAGLPTEFVPDSEVIPLPKFS